jgi:hypothetical protein
MSRFPPVSFQRSSRVSRHSREAGGGRRVGRRLFEVEVKDLKKVWIDIGISLVRAVDTNS